jgi:hypothetical protein
VAYDDLLCDWRRVVAKIRHELNLRWPHDDRDAHREIEAFLSPSERHHAISGDELQRHLRVPAWVKTAYVALRCMVRSDSAEERALLDIVRQDMAIAEQAYGPILTQYKIQNKQLRQRWQQWQAPQVEQVGPEIAIQDRQSAGDRRPW